MQFLNKLLCLAMLSGSLVSAVNPILAEDGCASHVSYDSSTGYSKELFIRTWSANGDTSFELQGNGGQTKKYSENGVEWVIHSKPVYAQNVIRCQGNTANIPFEGHGNAYNVCGDLEWIAVKLSGPKVDDDQPDPNRLVLGNNRAGYPLQFFWHDTPGGKLYLGRDGNTTWGVTRDETRIFPPAWRLRFLGKEGVLGENEVAVFLSAEHDW